MKVKVHIEDNETACVLFSEQADMKSIPSEVGISILCGETSGKEEKKCAESLPVSDFPYIRPRIPNPLKPLSCGIR